MAGKLAALFRVAHYRGYSILGCEFVQDHALPDGLKGHFRLELRLVFVVPSYFFLTKAPVLKYESIISARVSIYLSQKMSIQSYSLHPLSMIIVILQ